MKQLFFLAFISLLTRSGYQSGVCVIFKNDTGRDFIQLKVIIREQQYLFKDLKSGQQTEPLTVPESYRYCYAQAISAKDTITCQPIDFVGETLYKSGTLTMALFMFPGEGNKKYMGIR